MNEALDDQTHVAQPHVIIIGGGVGGLAAARALKKAPVRVTLVDRLNHLFQPLLYQVATALLAPADIASPIREVLGKQRNTTVALIEVTRVDAEKRQVFSPTSTGRSDRYPMIT